MFCQTSSARINNFDLQPHAASPAVPTFIDLRPRVVIAADDACIRNLLSGGLTAKGYFVCSAEDGESGWQSLSASPFDLLITDHEMPGLSGLDLLRRMRASSLRQPAILMSGNLPQVSPELEDLLSPGAAIAKPFSFDDLFQRIEALLDRTRSGTLP